MRVVTFYVDESGTVMLTCPPLSSRTRAPTASVRHTLDEIADTHSQFLSEPKHGATHCAPDFPDVNKRHRE